MSIVIQKFGGALLETPDLIRRAADLIIATRERGDQPVVVVSAPGKFTDDLIARAHEITETPDGRELDMLLSVGERTAMALLAMAIIAHGKYKAVSFTGSQVGIITDTSHTNARLIEVKGYRIMEALKRGEIPIVAGFQGVSTDREITTLGRGGSDATAVALAVALGASRCELVKEKGAVYTADPEVIPDAEPLSEVDFAAMQKLTAAGAKIVQSRAVRLARQHSIVLTVRGMDNTQPTVISDRPDLTGKLTALTLNDKVSVIDLPVGQDSVPASGAGRPDLPDRQSSLLLAFTMDGQVKAVVPSTDRDAGESVVLLTGVCSSPVDGSIIDAIDSALAGAGITPQAFVARDEVISILLGKSESKKAANAIHGELKTRGLLAGSDSLS